MPANRAASENGSRGSNLKEALRSGPDLPSQRPTGAEGLQHFFQHLLERAGTIDIGRYEARDRTALQRELVPELQGLLSEAARGLSAVREHYDFHGATTTIGGGVSDVAILASWEVQQKLQALLRASQDDTWTILASCARAHRVLFKSAIAVERAICDREGFATVLDTLSATALHRSLRIRRAYSVLRKEIEEETPRSQETLLLRFRHASDSLERLLRGSLYSDLRITDRVELTRIRATIGAWLEGRDAHDPVSGQRLWQDLASFADLLRQINHRDVLCAHDAAVIRAASRALFDKPPVEKHVADAVLIRLRSLWGRDEELDLLIENAAELDARRWEAPLRRLSETVCSREPGTNKSERDNDDASFGPKESTISREPLPSLTICKIDEACKALIGMVGGALACGVVDLHTGMPLGIYNAVENTEARNECFAAATVELFGGPRPRSLPWVARGAPRDDHDELPFEQVYIASKTTCQFARVIKNGGALIVLVTHKSASIGLASGLLRAAVPSVESLVP